MPEYLHPGVYVEEQPAPQTIEGVSTSTAGFVGATQKGPTAGLPQLVTSFDSFKRLYGSYLPEEPWRETRFLQHFSNRLSPWRIRQKATVSEKGLCVIDGNQGQGLPNRSL